MRINGCVPRFVGETRRFRFTSIDALDPPTDMLIAERLKVAVIGHTIVE